MSKTLQPNGVLTHLCNIYMRRRSEGMPANRARRFASDFFDSTEPFASIDPDELTDMLVHLNLLERIQLYVDRSCDLSQDLAEYLDSRGV